MVETALTIQFDELPGFTTACFGQFYELVRDRYPIVEDQPRLPRVVETFPQTPRVPSFEFKTIARPQRVYYRDAPDGARLIQLQPDRFGFNWRQGSDNEPYPSYDLNSQECLDEFDRFVTFAATTFPAEVKPNLCEVVYVNEIPAAEGESAEALFEKVFCGLRWQYSDGWLPREPEAVGFNRVYVISVEDKKVGRLYVEASTAAKKDRSELILLKITARVIHQRTAGRAEVEQSLRLAHDWVVNGFVSVTNDAIRRDRWKQDR